MSQYIKIYLDTGLFNTGIVGLMKLLDSIEEDYIISEQYMEVKKELFMRKDLAKLYLDMIFEKYKDTDRFGKLTSLDFDTCDEKVLDDYNRLFKNKTAPNICDTYNDTAFVELMNEYVSIPKAKVEAKKTIIKKIKNYLIDNKDLYYCIVVGHATRENLSEFFNSMGFLLYSHGNSLIKKKKPFIESLNAFIFNKLNAFVASYESFLTSNKFQCLQCRDISFPNKSLNIEMKFLKDFVDDPQKKQSPFWNFSIDAHFCPVCAFVYMLMPFGFIDVEGRTFKKDKLFINDNSSVMKLKQRNETYKEQKQDDEELTKYKVLNAIVLDELSAKHQFELNNIELILRESYDKRTFYSYSVLGKDILEIIKDSQQFLHSLVRKVKINDEYIDIFAEVLNNLINNANQWNLMQKLLRQDKELTSSRYNNLINSLLQIQLKQNKLKESGMKNEKKL